MKRKISRRNFLEKTAVTAGLSASGAFAVPVNFSQKSPNENKLPREVWIASLSQMGLKAKTSREMIDIVFKLIEDALVYKPDIVCLPEAYPFWGVAKNYDLKEKIKESAYTLEKASAFCKRNNCYLINPVYTSENGNAYNSAVVFDRKGVRIGEYRKAHPTEGEISEGIKPGILNPSVFHTDFGIIGVQICFDIQWEDTWSAIKDKGAEIVFFPSAFPGGRMVNAKACKYQYVIVSSTNKHTSKICDISGEVIGKTGIWTPNLVCAPVNLEKAFLHIWPYVKRFPEICQKYGAKVKITLYHDEEWAVIESLAPEIKVKDILDEFELRTLGQHIRDATKAQENARS